MEVLNIGNQFNYQIDWEEDVVSELAEQLKIINELSRDN